MAACLQVVFADEQALMDKATVHSSASDEASGSITSVQGDMSSQPEAQSLISVEFNFLDNMEYIYDSSSESETPPGPFSRPEGEEGAEEEEEEEEEEERWSGGCVATVTQLVTIYTYCIAVYQNRRQLLERWS